MRRSCLPVLAVTLAAVAACGSSGKGTVAAPPASASSSGSSGSSPSSVASSAAASTAAASTAATSSAAANGEAAKPAAAVLADAKAALAAAHSVHIKGGGLSDGAQIGLDLRLLGSQGGEGTITLKGALLQLLRTGRNVYVKGDDAFYREFAGTGSKGAAVVQLFHGKWLKTTTANSDFASLADFTSTAAFAKQLTPTGTLTKGAPGSLRGLPTVTLVDGTKGTLSVAASGQPNPLRLASSSSASGATTLDFLDYDVPVSLTPPPAADTVDLDALNGLGSTARPSAAG